MSTYDTLVEIGLVLAGVEHNFQAEEALERIRELLRVEETQEEETEVPKQVAKPKGVLAEVLSRVC